MSLAPALRGDRVAAVVLTTLGLACRAAPTPPGAPTPAPTEAVAPRSYADAATLEAALGLPATVHRGRAEFEGGEVQLWIAGDDREIALARLPLPPASCVDRIPDAEAWVMFDGPSGFALALAVPPAVLARDTDRGCLVAWPLRQLAPPADDAPPLGAVEFEIDRSESDELPARQVELVLEPPPRVVGPERIRLRRDDEQLALTLHTGSGRELARWVQDEGGCFSESFELRVHEVGRRLVLRLDQACDENESDHYQVSTVSRWTLVWTSGSRALDELHLVVEDAQSSWDWETESASSSEQEWWWWPVSEGRLERSRRRSEQQEAYASCQEDYDAGEELPEGEPEPCCEQRASTREAASGWRFAPYEPPGATEGAAGADDRRGSPGRAAGAPGGGERREPLILSERADHGRAFDNTDCEEWLEQTIDRGLLRRRAGWIWLPGDGLERKAADASEPCDDFYAVGVPPLRVPTAEELAELHAQGIAGAGGYWTAELPRHSGDRPELIAMVLPAGRREPPATVEALSLCVWPQP